MVSAIFTELGTIVSAAATLFVNIFTSAVGIFYTSGENPGLTTVGVLALVALGTGLLVWGFHYIRSLIRVKTK